MRFQRPFPRQAGITLVELLVSMTLGLLIVLAAVAAVVVSRQGFATVDAASQLRDNARFAAEILQRVAVQSGYQDVSFALAAAPTPSAATTVTPAISGFNNALLPSALGGDPLAGLSSDNRSAAAGGCANATDPACVNGSDVLVVQYQSGESVTGSGLSDGSMVNCVGQPETSAPTTQGARIVSIFHVAKSAGGEPTLMCTTKDAGGAWTSQPVVLGVESFQVLYGVDGVTPNAAPTETQDSIPDRFLRADQIVVPGNSAATDANWRRVRSLRVGLLVRAQQGTVQDRAGAVQPYYPLGTGAASPADAGSDLTPPDDARLRQTTTLTIHVRNAQPS